MQVMEGKAQGGDAAACDTHSCAPSYGLCQPGARHAGGEQRAAVVGEEHAGERERADAGRHGQHLRAGAHARAEQRQVRRRAEHVAVDVLPPGLLGLLRCARHGLDITTVLHTSRRALLVSSKGERGSSGLGLLAMRVLAHCDSATMQLCVITDMIMLVKAFVQQQCGARPAPQGAQGARQSPRRCQSAQSRSSARA